MSFFQKIGNAIVRFMYGRNGMDQLNLVLMWVVLFWGYIGVFLAQILFNILRLGVPALICEALLWPLMLLILFRMFSKNLPKRRAENQKFWNWWCGVKSRNAGAKARHADKDHKYFTCKTCGTVCRVPVGKGKIIITCPKCGAQIHAKT